MPTYQYTCTACGHDLEAMQSFTDDPLTECPACQGRLRKRYGAVGVVFKGSGFYRTDSRAASPNGAGSGGKDASGSGKDASAASKDGSGKDGSGTKNGAGTKEKAATSASS